LTNLIEWSRNEFDEPKVHKQKLSNLWRLIPMTNITISDLHPTDFDLLSNSDSYMRELSDKELNALTGGLSADDSFFLGALIGYGVGAIISGIWGYLQGFFD
jgi:hypothetical protein